MVEIYTLPLLPGDQIPLDANADETGNSDDDGLSDATFDDPTTLDDDPTPDDPEETGDEDNTETELTPEEIEAAAARKYVDLIVGKIKEQRAIEASGITVV